MKVSKHAVKAFDKNKDHTAKQEAPILSLVPDDEELAEEGEIRTKTGSFKLRSDPADPASLLYVFYMGFADGSQSIRFHLKWTQDVKKVLRGMAITTGPGQEEMVHQLCKGQVLTSFNESIMEQREASRLARATVAMNAVAAQGAAESRAAYDTRRVQAYENDLLTALDPSTTAMIPIALQATTKLVCPYKALEKQKRYMRRKMRKPADMKVRQYVNHLFRINYDELPLLPPFGLQQSLSIEELMDIVLFGIPKSWIKEMDRQDFDPFRDTTTISKVVAFCERLESAEDFTPDQKRAKDSAPNTKYGTNNKKSRFQSKGKSSKGDGKWCEYHETNTHDTSECSVLRKMKDGKKDYSSDKKSGKTWTRKSDDAKKFTKKELNALVKKKVKKELNTIAKRKKSDDDDDSDDKSASSLHMLENEMRDVDEQLKQFNFDDVKDDEISV